MILYKDFNVDSSKKRAVTIGNFDGVHLGHKMLISKTASIAKAKGITASVITFSEESFAKVLNLDITHITTVEEKKELMAELGIDELFNLTFSKEFMKTTCEAYLAILKNKLSATDLILGYDAKLGCDQLEIDQIDELCKQAGISLSVIDKIAMDGKRISSTNIRNLIKEGYVDKRLRECLGRDYSITGTVAHGKKMGKSTFDMPTANLTLNFNYTIPKYGVYYCKAEVDGKIYDSAVNVGINPTIKLPEQGFSIEVFLYNFKGDLYGKKLKIIFKKFIRPEIKFDNYEDLKIQMKKDAENISKLF